MSTLKVNNLQVGQDGTAANNYTLYQPASPDGTVRLGYGVAGSVTDILTLKNSRLGIGTNDPQSQFEVYGTSPIVRSKHSTSQKYTQINHDGTSGYLDWSSGSLLFRGASNTVRLRINSGGALSFTGAGSIQNEAADTVTMLSGGTASNAGANIVLYGQSHSSEANVISFRTSATERLRVTSAGYLFVPTDGAGIYGGGTFKVFSGSTAGRLDLYGGSTNHGGEIQLYGGSNNDGMIVFRTGAGSGQQSERLRITSNGAVNIGGNYTQTTHRAQITTGTNKHISFGSAAHNDFSDEGPGIFFSRPSDGSKTLSGVFQHSNESLGLATRGDLTIHAGGTSTYSASPERLRIDSLGSAQFQGHNAPAGLDTRISQYGSLLVATSGELISNARCSIDSGNGTITTTGNGLFAVNTSTYQTGINLHTSSNLSTLTVYSNNSSTHRSLVVYDNGQSGANKYRAVIYANGSAKFTDTVAIGSGSAAPDDYGLIAYADSNTTSNKSSVYARNIGGGRNFTGDNSAGATTFEVYSSGSVVLTQSAATSITSLDTLNSGGGDNRVTIRTQANQGGDPYIKFDAGGNNMIVGTYYNGTTNNKLVLGTGENPTSVKGLSIDGNGNGIYGNGHTSTALAVDNSSNRGLNFVTGGRIYCKTDDHWDFNLVGGGLMMRFRNGNDSGSGSQLVVGNITIQSNSVDFNTTQSDSRLKKNIGSWSEGVLQHFKTLQPKKFHFNWQSDEESLETGYIAQDLINTFPEAYPLCKTEIDGEEVERYSFNPSGMVKYLMKALQEEIVKREALEARLDAAGIA